MPDLTPTFLRSPEGRKWAEEQLALCERATLGTDGPNSNAGWYTSRTPEDAAWPIYRDGPDCVEGLGEMYSRDDAEFVTEARTGYPSLLRALLEEERWEYGCETKSGSVTLCSESVARSSAKCFPDLYTVVRRHPASPWERVEGGEK